MNNPLKFATRTLLCAAAFLFAACALPRAAADASLPGGDIFSILISAAEKERVRILAEENIEATDKGSAWERNVADYANVKPEGKLPILVNRDNVLPKEYVPKLVTVPGTAYQLEPDTYAAYSELMAAARDAGHKKLRLQSAFRTYNVQDSLYKRKISQYKSKYGAEAPARAAMIVAPPGRSEHQLGQACDIADNGVLIQSFGATEAGGWLAENAHKYGFILRYPLGKTEITGILYEPWHFRYVGVEIATLIWEQDITLEEFFVSPAADYFRNYVNDENTPQEEPAPEA